MFLNVAETNHIYISLSRIYMTILMICPMAVLMLLMMPKMYSNRKFNLGIISGSISLFILTIFLLRSQSMIEDDQYMKAMISHHSSAILTSQQAEISNSEVKKLAEEIIKAQKEEIALMKELLNRK